MGVTFAPKMISLSMRSSSIDGTVGITSVMVQPWNAFIHKVGEIGRDAWLDKLLVARN